MTEALDRTISNQRRAADPARSAFVSANAGSGKTRVLTDRVARLLLTGADPAKILCITFTKAAAAEMATRLFSLLGDWAMADDERLSEKLEALDGVPGSREPDALSRARRLFARALETPGGLKIQTIHSFCETVLKRFPLEAGVAPGFQVLDEAAARRLCEDALDRSLAGPQGRARASAERLAVRFGPDDLRALVIGATLSRQGLLRDVESAGGWDGLQRAAAAALGVSPEATERAAQAALLAAADRPLLEHARHVLAQGAKTAAGLADGPLADYLCADDVAGRIAALSAFFLTKAGDPRKKFVDAATRKIDPALKDRLADAQTAFGEGLNAVNSAAALEDMASFHTVLRATIAAYDAAKAARASIDYDDLIMAARALFRDPQKNAWVLYKLDHGLDHILLDEAQDTSPGQWEIVEGPLREFFAGAGNAAAGRCFFAVGDQKQPIYSFQGADAGLFSAKQQDLGKAVGAAARFENVPLTLSFRTTRPVLQFVDALFAEEEALQGLGETQPLLHGVNRAGEAGLVELWPPAPQPEKTELDAWDAPLDATRKDDPGERLCNAVAQTIADWIGEEPLASKGRAVAPGDIIILVQSRGPLFHRMIASLTRAGVPVAGADKLKLLEDPAVEDLVSYARAALLPSDDLSLAETLKSPFFGLDDGALFDLAWNRDNSLWRTLAARAEENDALRRARREIAAARRIGLHEGAYAFFSHVLEAGAPSGRRRLHERLGPGVSEPVDEFLRQALEYERANPRSLRGFLSWAETNAGEIKRELEQASDAVRVMTVHGAKGLEGEIVFLLDAHRRPDPRKLGPVFDVPPDPARGFRAPLLSPRKADDAPVLAAAREAARRDAFEEYRRLLYVAATRARDRLYICGIESGGGGDVHAGPVAEKSWLALAADAFARLDGVERAEHPFLGGEILRVSCPQEAPVVAKARAGEGAQPVAAPDWLFREAAPEDAQTHLAPSRLAEEEEALGAGLPSTEAATGIDREGAAYSPTAQDKYFRGRILHRLLELLPAVAREARAEAADALLRRLAPELPAQARAEWSREVFAVLEAPEFAAAFGRSRRAVVASAGARAGAREGVVVSGRIDRLVVEADRVLAIDYKTNRPPPARAEDVAEIYLAQMAAYRALLREIFPGRKIESALLWTFEARLTALPDALLDHAFARNLA